MMVYNKNSPIKLLYFNHEDKTSYGSENLKTYKSQYKKLIKTKMNCAESEANREIC